MAGRGPYLWTTVSLIIVLNSKRCLAGLPESKGKGQKEELTCATDNAVCLLID